MTHVSRITGKPSFISRHDQVITDPFSSECLRFEVDPIKYYGKENIYGMLKEYVSSHDEEQTRSMWINYQAREYIKLMTPGEHQNVELADDALQALLKLIVE